MGTDAPIVFHQARSVRWAHGICFATVSGLLFAGILQRTTLPLPVAVLIGGGLLALSLWIAHGLGGRRWLRFDQWTVEEHRPLGFDKRFDGRDVVYIHSTVARGAGHVYAIRLRGRGRARDTFLLPMGLYAATGAYDELLSRVAANPIVDADAQTRKHLTTWRARGSYPGPPSHGR